MSETKRVIGTVTGPSLQSQARFNENAVSDKVSETGFDYSAGILGPINTGVQCGAFKPVMVCNNSAAVHWVAFGVNGLAAPTGFTDGIMVPPNSCMVLASGANTFIRSDSALVGAYVAAENVASAS